MDENYNENYMNNENPGVFVNLTYDTSFKAVFADKDNRLLLIGLLNRILPEGVHVADIVKYLDREQQPDTIAGKRTLLDLICEDDEGRRFLVEFQRAPEDDFFQRCVYYGAGAYHVRLNRGQEYGELRPVYVVSMLNYCLPAHSGRDWDGNRIVSHYIFKENRTGVIAPPTISITFVELGRFSKSEEECSTDEDWLFYVFKHSGSFTDIPAEIMGKPLVKGLLEACRLAAFPKDKKLLYERKIMNEMDIIAQKKYAHKTGLAEGMAEGLAKGRAEGEISKARDGAVKFIAAGVPAETIAACLGLSIDEVRAIAEGRS